MIINVALLDHRDILAAAFIEIPRELFCERWVSDRRHVLAMITEHEGRLDHHSNFGNGLAERSGSSFQRVAQAGFLQNFSKQGLLGFRSFACQNPNAPARAQWILLGDSSAQPSWQENFADLAYLFGEGLCGLARHEPAVIRQRRSEDVKNPLVTLFVFAHSIKLLDSRTDRRPGPFGQLAESFEAK